MNEEHKLNDELEPTDMPTPHFLVMLAVVVVMIVLFSWSVTKVQKPFEQKKPCLLCGHSQCANPNDHGLPKWMEDIKPHYHADDTNICFCAEWPTELDELVSEGGHTL